MHVLWMIAWAIAALIGTQATAAAVELPEHRLEVTTDQGSGLLPLFLSSRWDRPQPDVVRALVAFHGLGRNASGYFAYAKEARRRAREAGRGTFIVAPLFPLNADLMPHRPAHRELLRWLRKRDWIAGRPALGPPHGPAPLSSFDAIDAVVARLADRALFPKLAQVVLAGHSAGGQIVQRYAIVGKGTDKLAAIGVRVRYVVANPSSYAYFTSERPRKTDGCEGFDDWKYGMNKKPPYAAGTASPDLERTYLERDVVYLLGTNDANSSADHLDDSCAGKAQGRNRLARGASYFAYLQARHPGLGHRLRLVFGVAHRADRMFTSPCGLAVLFDLAGCGR